MTITTTLNDLREVSACKEGYKTLATHLGGIRKYGAKTPIPLTEIVKSNGIADTFWVLRNACDIDGAVLKRLSVEFACDCAERVLSVFEAQRPRDDRPRKAIAAARGWLACADTKDAPHAADAAYAAADAAAYAAAHDAHAADAAHAAHAAHAAAYAAAHAAHAADAAAYAAAHAADAEREWQKQRLTELLENVK